MIPWQQLRLCAAEVKSGSRTKVQQVTPTNKAWQAPTLSHPEDACFISSVTERRKLYPSFIPPELNCLSQTSKVTKMLKFGRTSHCLVAKDFPCIRVASQQYVVLEEDVHGSSYTTIHFCSKVCSVAQQRVPVLYLPCMHCSRNDRNASYPIKFSLRTIP